MTKCALVYVVTMTNYRLYTGLCDDLTESALVCVVTLQTVHWSVW